MAYAYISDEKLKKDLEETERKYGQALAALGGDEEEVKKLEKEYQKQHPESFSN